MSRAVKYGGQVIVKFCTLAFWAKQVYDTFSQKFCHNKVGHTAGKLAENMHLAAQQQTEMDWMTCVYSNVHFKMAALHS